MKRMFVWFLLSCKRYLKKPSFLIILLLLPAACFLLRVREEADEQAVRIAVCVDGEGEADSFAQRLAAVLTRQQDQDSFIRFYECGDEEAVQMEVASRRAECGYVISGDLYQRLQDDNAEKCIRVYCAPSTVLDRLADEVVFAALAQLYDREIFTNYAAEQLAEDTAEKSAEDLAEQPAKDAAEKSAEDLAEQPAEDMAEQPAWDMAERPSDGALYELSREDYDEADSSQSIARTAGELFDKWLENGSTFRFEYRYTDGSGSAEYGENEETMGTEQADASIFPVRGLAAAVLFLIGVYSGMVLGMDEKRGLFLRLLPGERTACRIASAMAPTALAALACLAALWAGGCVDSWGKELAVMAVYVPAVTAYGFLLKLLLRKPQLVGCLIPFLLAATLIFCPVILDIGRFLPAFAVPGRLLPPWYYLRAF